MENRNRVQASVWKKWTEEQRGLFNRLYQYMKDSPQFFRHPQAVEEPAKHWNTTAWNAAWMAADLLGKVEWIGREDLVYEVV